jgi:hypothetical protein
MTGRSHTVPWWMEGGGVKTTENKIHWPRQGADMNVEFFHEQGWKRFDYLSKKNLD